MESGAATYSAVFFLGTSASFLLPADPLPFIAILPLLILVSYYTKKNPILFLAASHCAMFIAGISGCALAREGELLPIPQTIQDLSSRVTSQQHHIAEYLKSIIPHKDSHATLCALTIGDKSLMTKELKGAFSSAGAMHVLALSGLHIGIAFAIIYRLLAPLTLIPYGKFARNAAALVFIVGYTLLSGCSPSVVRAATMIFIYKIAAGTFRKTSPIQAIALALMVTCAIAPLQVKSIGFQLSYCAVAGIALLFPVCTEAFKTVASKWKWMSAICRKLLEWLWGTVSLSVCCQIATLPVSLYYFGSSAPYFLITNLVAVPTATAILYTFTATMLLQPVPILGDAALHILKMLLSFLNSSTSFIAG